MFSFNVWEIVQCNGIALIFEIRQPFEQWRIGRTVRADLEHNPAFRQGETVVAQQEIGREVYKRDIGSDNLIQSDIHEGFQQQSCRGAVAVRERGAIQFTVAAKQFIGKYIHAIPVNRLPSDECPIHNYLRASVSTDGFLHFSSWANDGQSVYSGNPFDFCE